MPEGWGTSPCSECFWLLSYLFIMAGVLYPQTSLLASISLESYLLKKIQICDKIRIKFLSSIKMS